MREYLLNAILLFVELLFYSNPGGQEQKQTVGINGGGG